MLLQIRQLPESVIVETTEYKCLQSQFSVLYNESMQLKTQLDEARLQLQTSKNAHLRQIEMMEVIIVMDSFVCFKVIILIINHTLINKSIMKHAQLFLSSRIIGFICDL